MTLAEELMASRRCEMSTMLSISGVVGHLSGVRSDFSDLSGQALLRLASFSAAAVGAGDVNLQVKTSYTSGMILTDWQTMKRTEMETRTMPRFASRFCLAVISA